MREVLVNYLEQPKAHQKFNQDIFLYDCAGTTMCRNGGFNSVKWNPCVFTSQLSIAGSGQGGKCILFSHLPSSPSSYRKLPLAAAMHISKVDLNIITWQINSWKHWNCCWRASPWPAAECSCSFPRLGPFSSGRQCQIQARLQQSPIPLPSEVWLLILNLAEPEEGREGMDCLPSAL